MKYVEEKLEKYCERDPVRFHMPGHKGTKDLLDVTELSATDDLNNPESFFKDAQEALSASYGSAHSFFMVNGSTGAIHAMIKYASVVSGLPILMQRNSHKSIGVACMLFGVKSIIIEDEYDNSLQAFVFNEEKIIEAVNKHESSALVLTSIDYFGRTVDLSRIAKACRQKNVLLLCDEAHGAHLHISSRLPESALRYADICVHSPHKTLSALTQCSYIHISDKIDTEKITSLIRSLQTSSPSFVLTHSMDIARFEADTMKKNWEKRIDEVYDLQARLDSIEKIETKKIQWAKNAGYCGKDPTRLVIDVGELGSGIEIGKILEEKYNIFMEMYTFRYITGIMTPWDDKLWGARLQHAFLEISKMDFKKLKQGKYPQQPKKIMEMQDALNSKWEKVNIKEAAGRAVAVSLGTYPPGVPIVSPGEIISGEAVEYINAVKNQGGSIFGNDGENLLCIKE